MYLHTYLHICSYSCAFFIFISQIFGFLRISGLFVSFSLVYTTILEQKRIAGQVENIFICILFKKICVLFEKP